MNQQERDCQFLLDNQPNNMISHRAAGITVLALVWILADPVAARQGKMFSLFNIIQFENGPCAGSSGRNGTCYTSGECDQRGGTNDGTCAAGFGVCCSFVKMCGETIAQASSYLVPSNPMPESGDCSYKICKLNNDICRIRLDFQTFLIANPMGVSPIVPPVQNAIGMVVENVAMNEGGIGDCLMDSFSVRVPGGIGSPEICGFNTGQHMILDASPMCITASFIIGTSRLFKNDWDIRVTQLECSNMDAGPPGCLQYFTETKGTIKSFGFSGPSTNGFTVPHLSNQHYSICFRNPPNVCGICFMEANQGTNEIPNALVPDPGRSQINLTLILTSRLCGRTLSSIESGDAFSSVCTNSKPFKLVFKTDASEADREVEGSPSGTLGFALDYVHDICGCQSGSGV